MLKTIRNAWKVPEIRSKMIFTLVILVIYRLGATLPMPFVIDLSGIADLMSGGSMLGYLNIMSGQTFAQAKLFALSVSPYITSSIVMQLLTIAIPALERLSKEGEEGKKKINQITRFVTVALALFTAIGYYFLLKNQDALDSFGSSVFGAIVMIACYVAGSSLIMWLAEKINEKGIGNGVSLILFVNIVSSGPALVSSLWALIVNGSYHWAIGILIALAIVVVALAIVVFVVFITNSERRLPVQYAKRVVGNKMYGGQSTNLPIKLNMAGVMPIIFSSSIVSIPATIASFVATSETSFWYKLANNWFSPTSPLYMIVFFVLIVAFSYFYIGISFNPIEVANNLKKNGGFIPGLRPGKPTSQYITKVLGRITLIGAFFLAFIAIFPMIVNAVSGSAIGNLAFGGSSLLIIVGVALETARELEAQLSVRHYKGFLD